MALIKSDNGKGRTFVIVHETGSYEEFVTNASAMLAGRVRAVVIETEVITETNWNRASNSVAEKLQELGVRQCALVGFGGAASLVQHLVLTSPKSIRSIALIDATFRPHPNTTTRILDWIEGILPLGLPLRSKERGFDAKPFAQRIRCPALIVLTRSASAFIHSQAHEIAARIPSAWVVSLEEDGAVAQFCDLLDTFEGVPVKCPQKNRAAIPVAV